VTNIRSVLNPALRCCRLTIKVRYRVNSTVTYLAHELHIKLSSSPFSTRPTPLPPFPSIRGYPLLLPRRLGALQALGQRNVSCIPICHSSRIQSRLSFIMFTLRLTRSSSFRNASKGMPRPFSSTPTVCRTPSLADITPDGATSFETKQRAFRAHLAELQKKKFEASKWAIEILYSSFYNTPPSLALNTPSVNNATTRSPTDHHLFNMFT
jgi:hypothetical protein